MKVISWKNKPIFTEIILVFIRQNTIPYDQRHYQFCFVIKLTTGGNRDVSLPPVIATCYYLKYQLAYLLPTQEEISNTENVKTGRIKWSISFLPKG